MHWCISYITNNYYKTIFETWHIMFTTWQNTDHISVLELSILIWTVNRGLGNPVYKIN